jgi:hypothetical protein
LTIDDTATKAVLVGSHLLAAAIIIPTLGQRLTAVKGLSERLDEGSGDESETAQVRANCPDQA